MLVLACRDICRNLARVGRATRLTKKMKVIKVAGANLTDVVMIEMVNS